MNRTKSLLTPLTFSRLFLSNNLASFELDPPARIRLPSILLNCPQYRNTGSFEVLRLASQSMVPKFLAVPKSQVCSCEVWVQEAVRMTPSLVSIPSPQIRGPNINLSYTPTFMVSGP